MWKEIGRRMGIQDIPPTREDLETWSNVIGGIHYGFKVLTVFQEYENKHMTPSKSSRKLANLAVEHIGRRVPFGFRNFAKSAFISLLDERLRVAMM